MKGVRRVGCGLLCAYDPPTVARDWADSAKRVFDSMSEPEKRLGSKILMVGVSPTETLGAPHAHRIYLIRFSAPDFRPGFIKQTLSTCSIGSGAGIRTYKHVMKEFTNPRSSALQMQILDLNVWGVALTQVLTTTISENPTRGISKHLHLFLLEKGRVIARTNDHTMHPPNNAEPIEFRMPPVARSFDAFDSMANSVRAESACAAC